MRSKIASFLLAFIILLVLPLVVYAQGTPQNRVQNRKDAVAQRKDAAQQKREEFKTRLQTIRDEKKKAAVERIDTKIANMNEVQTVRFTTVLTKLQSILDRVSQKVKAAEANGKDTALADAAIADAQAAIDKAKAAVSAQAAKTYIIQISDEAALRNSVGATTSQFKKDLRDVHKLIIDAKQAVQNTVRELAKVASAKGVNPNSATGGAVTQ
ncbi:MAG: hypothetical protein Q8Q96_00950 [bacterium]|nr:hypothetical protein [bacterium]